MKRILTAISDLRQGKTLFFRLRSSKWRTVRRKFLAKMPICAVCFERDMSKLEVHHIIPFHLDPSLELVDSNLITLCNEKAMDCHLIWGHFQNYRKINPDIGYMRDYIFESNRLGRFT